MAKILLKQCNNKQWKENKYDHGYSPRSLAPKVSEERTVRVVLTAPEMAHGHSPVKYREYNRHVNYGNPKNTQVFNKDKKFQKMNQKTKSNPYLSWRVLGGDGLIVVGKNQQLLVLVPLLEVNPVEQAPVSYKRVGTMW